MQVVDPEANEVLQERLERQLQELDQVSRSSQTRVGPLNLSSLEQTWLVGRDPKDLNSWKLALRKAQQRMLSQGIVGSLAKRQLEQAARLQLSPMEEPGPEPGQPPAGHEPAGPHQSAHRHAA